MSEKPGRKPEAGAFRKRQLSNDAKIILALSKKQPQTIGEICQGTGMSDRTFYRISAFLQEENVIKSINGMYALSSFEFLEKEIEEIFGKFLSQGQVVYSTWLVDATGKTWKEIEPASYKVAKKLGLNILPEGTSIMFLKTS